ncbi:MAG: hypothetical protein RML72_07780 [Bacteroidia bacterium]|nr:hypothetical protein [Bacteroidia bacterium]
MFYYYRFFVERIVFITLFVAITCEARAQFYISLLHDTLPNPSQIRAAKIKSRWLWMYKYENGENYGLAKCLKKQYFDRNGYLVEEWVYDTTEATVDYKTFFEYNFDGRLQKSRDEKNGVLIATTRYYYQGTTPRISKIQRTFQDGTIDYTLQYSYDSKGRVVAATLDYGAGFEHQNKNFKVR